MLAENKFNQLSEKIIAISTKGSTNDLINKFSIVNDSKYFLGKKCFYLGICQSYLVFIPAKNTLNIIVSLLGLICGNLIECQTKMECQTKNN